MHIIIQSNHWTLCKQTDKSKSLKLEKEDCINFEKGPIDRQFVYRETNILVRGNCWKYLENSKSYVETISSSFNSAIAHIFSTISSPCCQKEVIELIYAIQ